jgi:hypothetical protein
MAQKLQETGSGSSALSELYPSNLVEDNEKNALRKGAWKKNSTKLQ